MHNKRNVIHRDIKFENIMFENKDPHAQIKLIDFGMATYYHKSFLTAHVGTVYTMSQESDPRNVHFQGGSVVRGGSLRIYSCVASSHSGNHHER